MTQHSQSHSTETDGPVLTRGHKKKARTRQALVEAALRIYAQKGVGELQLNELAEEAQVSNGTVYNYFRTREEVLEAVGVELANQLSQRVSAVSIEIEDGARRLTVGVRMFIHQARQDPQWASAVVRVFQYDRNIRSLVASNLRNDLRLGLQQGLLHYGSEDVALGLVAFSTMGTITAMLDGYDSPDGDQVLAEMLLMGLGVPAAKARRIATLPLPAPQPAAALAEPRKRGRPRQTGTPTS